MEHPQNTLGFDQYRLGCKPAAEGETHIMMGMKIEGRSFLSKMLVKGSKTEYEMKKMVRVAL